jgi:hypothetical protein
VAPARDLWAAAAQGLVRASADACRNPWRGVIAGSEVVFVSENLVIAPPY